MKEYNEQTRTDIVEAVRRGLFKVDAARINGVSETTLHRWQGEYPEFKEAIEQAILEYKRDLIQYVTIAAVKSGKIALEVLRTRWPKEWNVAKKVQLTDPEGELKKLMRIIMGTATESDMSEVTTEEQTDNDDVSEISEPAD